MDDSFLPLLLELENKLKLLARSDITYDGDAKARNCR